MSSNIQQIFVANPASSMQSLDLLYLGRSPYGASNDMAITWANMQASITATGTIATGIWQGSVIALAYGGTNANLTASNGGIIYSTASAMAVLAGTATANQVLLSGSGAAPAWSTATYPATTTINQLLYSSSANVIAGLATANNATLITSAGGVPSISQTLPAAVQQNITAVGTVATGVWQGTAIGATYGGTGVANPTAHTLPVAEGSSAMTFLGPLTNGQLLIGSTGADPVAAAITAGAGISITNNAGSITVTATGSGAFNWTVVTGATQTMASNNGYIANRATLVTLTLPGTANVGDEIDVIGQGAGGWSIAQPAGVTVRFGTASTTTGVGGSLSSTAQRDTCFLICTTANTEWTVYSAVSAGLTVV